MRSSLPEWAQWIQAIGPVITAGATVAIGAIVAFIAWRQWQTARDKTLLDLFDRRMAIYTRAVGAIGLVIRDGAAGKNSSFLDLIKVTAEAQFLFDDDVVQFLEGWVDRLREISVADSIIVDPEAEERKEWIQRKYTHLRLVEKFRPELTTLCARYMRMTQAR